MAASGENAARGAAGAGDGWFSPPVLAHTAPFAAWVALRLAADLAVPDRAWPYAVQTVTGAALLVLLRPWRYYAPFRWRDLPAAVLVGVLVLALWVMPFLRWGDEMPWFQEFYLRFGVLPLGSLPRRPAWSPYAPGVCGWPMTLVRLAGSAFVIATAEEFFWRGFLYRRLARPDFLQFPLAAFDLEACCWSCVVFGLEHREVLAGIAAGMLYLVLMRRTQNLWAAVAAHVTTNLLLGVYVIRTGAYEFW